MDMNTIVRYFDLASEKRTVGGAPMSAGQNGQTPAPILPQYLALFLGIVVQPYLVKYISNQSWDLKGFWGWFAASALIALIAFPGIYKKSFDLDKPIFVQLCVIFTSGMGWQSIVGAALKGVSSQ